jgi:hypothetical protein
MKIRDKLIQRIPAYVNNLATRISNGLWQGFIMGVRTANPWGRKLFEIWELFFLVKVYLKETNEFMGWGRE